MLSFRSKAVTIGAVSLTLFLLILFAIFHWGIPAFRMEPRELKFCLLVAVVPLLVWGAHALFEPVKRKSKPSRYTYWIALAVIAFHLFIIPYSAIKLRINAAIHGTSSVGYANYITVAFGLAIPIFLYFLYTLIARRRLR